MFPVHINSVKKQSAMEAGVSSPPGKAFVKVSSIQKGETALSSV